MKNFSNIFYGLIMLFSMSVYCQTDALPIETLNEYNYVIQMNPSQRANYLSQGNWQYHGWNYQDFDQSWSLVYRHPSIPSERMKATLSKYFLDSDYDSFPNQNVYVCFYTTSNLSRPGQDYAIDPGLTYSNSIKDWENNIMDNIRVNIYYFNNEIWKRITKAWSCYCPILRSGWKFMPYYDCNDDNYNYGASKLIKHYADTDDDGFGSLGWDGTYVPYNCFIDGYIDNDDDCNDMLSEVLDQPINWYADLDNDGFGFAYGSIISCYKPSDNLGTNFVINSDDCDDNDPYYNIVEYIWYADFDNDGFGDENDSELSACPVQNYIRNCYFDKCPSVSGTRNGCPIELYDFDNDNSNYVYEKVYLDEFDFDNLSNATNEDKIEKITYKDGLGRSIQENNMSFSTSGKDIITHFEYNENGNQTKFYLPYSSSETNGLFDENSKINTLNFYNTQSYEYTTNPYSEILLESSPSNRIIESGAPGEDWKIDLLNENNHTIKNEYGFNSILDYVKNFNIIYESGLKEKTKLNFIGEFNSGELRKTIIKNENWTQSNWKDHTTEEFKNSNGQVVLRRSYNEDRPHDTYYVYDKFGNLTYVVPPLASDAILKIVYTQEEQESRIASQTNYSWIDLVMVDKTFAEEYNKKLADYENDAILNADIQNEYGGQGGFTVSTFNDSDLVTLSISLTASTDLELKQGELMSLKSFGKFKDTELGRVSGTDYEYIFTIKNNAIYINGNGKLSSINQALNSNIKLSYSKDYLWTTYTDVDSKFASSFEKTVLAEAKATNQSILTVNLANEYGGQGGLNVSIDENDNISLIFNSSTSTPLKLKQGAVIKLDTERKLENRTLGTISGAEFSYKLILEDNSIVIEGHGTLTAFNGSCFPPPPTSELVVNQITVQGLCYIYNYDYRNRLIEKKIPGKGWELIVYDKLDRPILTQDANLRLQNKWLFTKYDEFSRVAYTGIHTFNPVNNNYYNSGRLELQEDVNQQTVFNETKNTTGTSINGTTLFYSQNSIPNVDIELHTINYYDDYNVNVDVLLDYQDSYNQTQSENNRDLATISQIRVLSTESWITNVIYYDNKGRPIYSVSKNEYLNTLDWMKLELDFIGKELETTSHHQKNGQQNIDIVNAFTYNYAGQLLTQTQIVNNSLPELIVNNHYNELGLLESKNVGGRVNSIIEESIGLQTIDYNYNIRGWLKSINNGTTIGNDLFGFALKYNDPITGIPLYNGNISETHWQTASDHNPRSYDYSYDALNRIESANYHGNYALFDNPVETEDYSLGKVKYDKNGNITYLNRTGLNEANNEIDYIDDLTYNYEPKSNTLKSIVDSASEDGFKDGNTSDEDYFYDVNGNMTVDKNKNIIAIEYNHLNLPTNIQFDNSSPVPDGAITYVYDATGVKMKKQVSVEGAGTTITQYAGNYIYEYRILNIPGGTTTTPTELKFFSHAEGYAEPNTFGNFDYIYQYKDHLGNIRLSYKNTGNVLNPVLEIQQENNYYPFGLKQKGYNGNITSNNIALKRMFGSKEYQDELELDWYDISARNYDPALGRWFVIDPKADDILQVDLSPYNYGWNNPINVSDPDGECPWCWGALFGFIVDYGVQVYQGRAEGKDWEDALIHNINLEQSIIAAGTGALTGGLSSFQVIGVTAKVYKGVGLSVTAAFGNIVKQGLVDENRTIEPIEMMTDAVFEGIQFPKVEIPNVSRNTINTVERQLDRAERVAGDNPRPSREQAVKDLKEKVETLKNKKEDIDAINNIANEAKDAALKEAAKKKDDEELENSLQQSFEKNQIDRMN